MRRITLASILALAASLFIGAAAGAEYYDYEFSAAPQVGVQYTVGDGAGQLTILGGAGLSVEAYDAAGAPIVGTVAFDSVTTVSIPVASGSDVIYVQVGSQWYACSSNDPDWHVD